MATCCAVLQKQVAKSDPGPKTPDLSLPDSYAQKL